VLARAIVANPDGTFTVTFHELEYLPHPTRKYETVEHWKPVKVTVDADLAGNKDWRLYAEEGRGGKELRVPLLEKAYASWKGGYEEIGNGGWPGQPLQSLAARPYQSIYLTERGSRADLEKMVAQGGAGVACSRDAKDVKGTGIIGAHAYSVLGVEEKGGKTYVQLRNPWGHAEAGKDGKDDGTFLLPWETFTKAFHLVEYV
jgi:hypothetical protein